MWMTSSISSSSIAHQSGAVKVTIESGGVSKRDFAQAKCRVKIKVLSSSSWAIQQANLWQNFISVPLSVSVSETSCPASHLKYSSAFI